MSATRAIYRTCSECGERFVIGPSFQDYIEENNLKLPRRCKNCRELRKKEYEVRKCVTCGNDFTITQNEYKFYSERGLSIPLRCHDCRRKRHERFSKDKE